MGGGTGRAHLHGPLPVHPEGLHDAQHLLVIVAQVGVVAERSAGGASVWQGGVGLHPPVLPDLGDADALGRVHHQHAADQRLTVWGSREAH